MDVFQSLPLQLVQFLPQILDLLCFLFICFFCLQQLNRKIPLCSGILYPHIKPSRPQVPLALINKEIAHIMEGEA